jgi:cell wall-associated NlpC family hydrolase
MQRVRPIGQTVLQVRWRSRARLATLVVAAACSAACATASAVARPMPFPNAPPSPLSFPRPALGYATPTPDALVQTALTQVGAPYRLGGDEPAFGFDCSGLVRYVFLQHYLDLPRTVAELFHVGQSIDLDDARPGDLVFFSTVAPGASHVGITLGRDQMTFVHAPGLNGAVRVESLTPYWRARVVGVRRVF